MTCLDFEVHQQQLGFQSPDPGCNQSSKKKIN